MMTLKGRTCLFAGGAGDIGEGAVRALAEGGMNVVLITHNPAKAEAIRETCKDVPGKVLIKTGVSSFADLLLEIREECGSLDVYINKTGGFSAPCSFEEITVNAAALSGMIPDHRADPAKDLVWTEEQIPLGHLGTTEEFGAFVSYIVSEEAGFTTGHIFNLTGGRVIG